MMPTFICPHTHKPFYVPQALVKRVRGGVQVPCRYHDAYGTMRGEDGYQAEHPQWHGYTDDELEKGNDE